MESLPYINTLLLFRVSSLQIAHLWRYLHQLMFWWWLVRRDSTRPFWRNSLVYRGSGKSWTTSDGWVQWVVRLFHSTVFWESLLQGGLTSFEPDMQTSSWTRFLSLHSPATGFSGFRHKYPLPEPGPLPNLLAVYLAPGLSWRQLIEKGSRVVLWVGTSESLGLRP
jgi:hypothetical protein